MIAEKKEAYPLSWPDGWPRTRIQDRRAMASWKRTANQYRDAIGKELALMGAPTFVISSNVPLTERGGLDSKVKEPPDNGVAVYFSRKMKEDFSWQAVLDIHVPAPSESEIEDAFTRLAKQHHPDRPGGDLTLFRAAADARRLALDWVRGTAKQRWDYVIPNDQFKELRLNLAAIAASLRALRQLDRCGSTGLLERAFKGFSALPAHVEAAAAAGAR